MSSFGDTRVYDLLAERATQGLDAEEQRELDALLALSPDLDDDSFELAAAAVELACLERDEPLPSDLRSRLSSRARDFYASSRPPSRF